MMFDIHDFAKKLASGPIYLYLGQSAFNINEEDFFLKRLSDKYELEESNNYNIIYDKSLSENVQLNDWADKFLNDMPMPDGFEILNELPLSSVYTSSFNSKLLKYLSNHFRNTAGVYNDKQMVVYPRNIHNLHINYLYGCFNQEQLEYRVPKTYFEKVQRNGVAANMLQKITDNITPFGVLLVEGYNPERDWLSIENYFNLLSNLAEKQIFMFSVNESLKANEFIQQLISDNKLIVFEYSLYNYLNLLKQEDLINFSSLSYENFYGHTVKIGTKRVQLTNEIFNRISRTATLIEQNLFEHPLKVNDDYKLAKFKDFLANSSHTPRWSGYPLSFAFERDFFVQMKRKVVHNIQSNKTTSPVIVHGQGSSGKTIALGLLAYELYKEVDIPILFVERKYDRLDEYDIDDFYNFIEQNGGDKIILIWDGMLDPSTYYSFLKKLDARGKNLIMVASSYRKDFNSVNLIEANIKLADHEIKRFEQYLSGFMPDTAALIKYYREDNFLAMLFRYLDSSRLAIRQSLYKEISTASSTISNDYLKEGSQITTSGNSLGEYLKKAGIYIQETDLDNLEREILIAGDNITQSGKLLNMIMVAGQFGLEVPFDLLIRSINLNVFNKDLFKVLSKHDIVKWNEDYVGNITLGPRTTFEARLIVESLGGYRSQVDYIKDLISSLRDTRTSLERYDSNSDEIQFISELLYHISPNSGNKNFIQHLYEISVELGNLRNSHTVINPRLMLQEASFLREIAKKDFDNQPITSDEMLDRAEEVLREALTKVENPKSLLFLNLQVELASILGTKLKQELKHGNFNKTKAASFFRDTYYHLFNSGLLNGKSYHALDVLYWSSQAALESNIFNEDEYFELQSNLLRSFDQYESEGVEEIHEDEFLKRQIELADLIGKSEITEDALNRLKEKGSCKGYYLMAKKILGKVSLNDSKQSDENIDEILCAYDYLDKLYSQIESDADCVSLLFKLFWVSKTGHGFITTERSVLRFDPSEWSKCLFYIEKIQTFGENYYTPTIQYLHGICLFHLERYPQTIALFSELNDLTDFTNIGKKRVIKTYIAAGTSGQARIFNGEIKFSASISNKKFKGEIYVPDIKINIPFSLKDFHYREVYTKQPINNFYIGFNYRGLIAIPSK